MLRVLCVPVLILALHVTALTAAAIPSCPVGATIAVYLALGADGCSVGDVMTFSHFAYTGFAANGEFLPPLAARLTPVNLTAPLVGVGLIATSDFVRPPGPLAFNGFKALSLSFQAAGAAHVKITGDHLVQEGGVSRSPFGSGFYTVTETVTPGGMLSTVIGIVALDVFFNTSDSITISPTMSQDVHMFGGGFGPGSITSVLLGFDTSVAPMPTPEPATLLLVGTGAAGLGLARWWKRRRAREGAHAA